jgi:probable F420-dependent oxidoreductase
MVKITLMCGRFNELPGGDMAQAFDLARMAEETGLHGVALGEHVALGTQLDHYPYAGGLRHPEGAKIDYLEPVAFLGGVAAVTSRVRLSNSIMLAPLRPAVLLAKQLATLDVLSRGRCEPVFGSGWSREEYRALGVDFSARRRILRDNIAACRVLWGEQPATFTSETVTFEGLHSMPRPIQKRIPILLGVKANEKNAPLIAELCDGWETGPDDSKSPAILREGVERLRQAFVDAGRDPKKLIVRAHIPIVWKGDKIELERSFDGVPAALEAGVTQFALPMPVGYSKVLHTLADIGRYLDKAGRLAEQY